MDPMLPVQKGDITGIESLPQASLQELLGALHRVTDLLEAQRRDEEALSKAFQEHVERWKSDTMHWSSVTRMIAHPSYLRVIGLARRGCPGDIERLLLRELQAEPDHWFAALSAIAGEDPVTEDQNFDEAVEAWLEWGRRKGYLQ